MTLAPPQWLPLPQSPTHDAPITRGTMSASFSSCHTAAASEVLTCELLTLEAAGPPATPAMLLPQRLDTQTLEDLFAELMNGLPTASRRPHRASRPIFAYSSYSELMDTVNLLGESGQLLLPTPSLQRVPRTQRKAFEQVPKRFSLFILDQQTAATLRHTRDISDLMGSQATIFSTRPEDAEEQATQTSLVRRRAIRARHGGLWYRARARMRRAARRVREFVARTRLALRRKVRAPGRRLSTRRASRARPSISAPLANKDLGLAQGAARVPFLLAELRQMAGQQVVPEAARNERLSGASPATGKSARGLGADTPDVPPTPPPHGALHEYLDQQRQRKQAVALWRQYLARVVAQRITLRQEIAVYQLLHAQQALPPQLAPQYAQSHRASVTMTEMSGIKSRATFAASERAAEPGVDTGALMELDSDSEQSDKVARVFNRRSMLGDMLDYSSDSEASVVLVELAAPVGRYGTVRRKSPDPPRPALRPPLPLALMQPKGAASQRNCAPAPAAPDCPLPVPFSAANKRAPPGKPSPSGAALLSCAEECLASEDARIASASRARTPPPAETSLAKTSLAETSLAETSLAKTSSPVDQPLVPGLLLLAPDLSQDIQSAADHAPNSPKWPTRNLSRPQQNSTLPQPMFPKPSLTVFVESPQLRQSPRTAWNSALDSPYDSLYDSPYDSAFDSPLESPLDPAEDFSVQLAPHSSASLTRSRGITAGLCDRTD